VSRSSSRGAHVERTVGARLLLAERDAIIPLLRALPDSDFDRPTLLPGWSVRDVLAHCAAAMTMAASGRMHGFSPAENQRDVDERRPWPIPTLLTELAGGYVGAAAAITNANGRLDGLSLGEWTHGGDVRDALGRDDAYASAGLDDALSLFERLSHNPRYGVPPTDIRLADRRLTVGASVEQSGAAAPDSTAVLETDAATLVRLMTGRSPDPARYQLSGAEPAQYVMFR
jgi:uncharacterized protein (TIGR03083 family)